MIKKLLFACGFALGAISAQAATVDASFEDTSAYSLVNSSYYEGLLQTFTVGSDGILDRVEVYADTAVMPQLRGSETLTFAITELPSGGSLGTTLLSMDIAYDDIPHVPSWIGFDVSSANLAVAVGDQLGILLRTADDTAYGWRGSFGDGYAGGMLYTVNGTGVSSPVPGFDRAFRAYVAQPAPVPLPASSLLLIAGLGGLIALRRRA